MARHPAHDDLTLRTLDPGEGARLVACIRRCYGESHVDPGLYDASALDAALAAGLRHAAVAVTPEGDVVAHLGIAFRRKGDPTADTGLTLVDPAYRGRGLATRLAALVGAIAQRIGVVGLHDYPVTVHGATQRLGSDHAHAVGLLLDNMPADVEFNAMSDRAAGRATASLVRYIPVSEAVERRVHVPTPYRALSASLYRAAGLRRELADSTTDRARIGARLEIDHDPRRGTFRASVVGVEGDPGDLADAVAQAPTSARVLHVDLPLGHAGTPAWAAQLRGSGFFFGALLPEFRDGDVLRLQRLRASPDPSSVPVLEAESLRAIRDFVFDDAARISDGAAHDLPPPTHD